MPLLLKRAENTNSFKKLKISSIVSVLFSQNENEQSLWLKVETVARDQGATAAVPITATLENPGSIPGPQVLESCY